MPVASPRADPMSVAGSSSSKRPPCAETTCGPTENIEVSPLEVQRTIPVGVQDAESGYGPNAPSFEKTETRARTSAANQEQHASCMDKARVCNWLTSGLCKMLDRMEAFSKGVPWPCR